jgi:hypothetical protein
MTYASVKTFGVHETGDDTYDRVDRLACRITSHNSGKTRRAPPSVSSERLAAETEQRRIHLTELYARSRRHAPPGVRECEQQLRTISS